MPNKRSNKNQDLSRIAVDLLEEAVGEPAPITPAGRKNPASADSRRAGGPKAGAAGAKLKATVKLKTKGLPANRRKA